MHIPHPGDLISALATGVIYLTALLLNHLLGNRHPKLYAVSFVLVFVVATLFSWWINTVWS